MKPTDLRIGNWVNFRIDGNPIRITAKDLLDAETRPLEGWQAIYKPIPLTSEMFKKNNLEEYDDFAWAIEEWKIHIVDGVWFFDFCDEDIEDVLSLQPVYVHELQNIYYIMSGGEELEINL